MGITPNQIKNHSHYQHLIMALSLPPHQTAKDRAKPPILFTSTPPRRSPPHRFRSGDLVEIASFQDGFRGSYYEATVVADLPNGNYAIEYRTLVTDDFTAPLRESVSASEVRPRPPAIRAAEFRMHDVVDVLANDGWWVGRVTGRIGDDYSVFFGSTVEEIWYAKDLLRIHQERINGEWVCL